MKHALTSLLADTVSPELRILMEAGLIGGDDAPLSPRKANKAAKSLQNVYDMIGGDERMAMWADKNPSKFYPLYMKLVPSTIEGEVQTTVKWDAPWLTKRNLITYEPVEDARVISPPAAND